MLKYAEKETKSIQAQSSKQTFIENKTEIQYMTQTGHHHTDSIRSVPLLCEVKVKAVNLNAAKSLGAAQFTLFPLSVKIPCPTTNYTLETQRHPLTKMETSSSSLFWFRLDETHAPPPFWPLWNLQKVDMVSKWHVHRSVQGILLPGQRGKQG